MLYSLTKGSYRSLDTEIDGVFQQLYGQPRLTRGENESADTKTDMLLVLVIRHSDLLYDFWGGIISGFKDTSYPLMFLPGFVNDRLRSSSTVWNAYREAPLVLKPFAYSSIIRCWGRVSVLHQVGPNMFYYLMLVINRSQTISHGNCDKVM
jgi:hypothetical protein